ncbi:hypothetical protein O1611_g8048 [Lasiodiplodia mahajangana]|uniref:Uncharacterized protein n=1 Tax=Lasiodiplodia mahajangana TaxID=1108764 RepID=A0ACC2JDT0_9PEZI|nr:hypothetical protein O1611_g8048 [Lasiodiplodia mahajangana]
MLRPNATIAIVVTVLILGAFIALCVSTHRFRESCDNDDDDDDSNESDSDVSSMYYVSTSTATTTSHGDPDVAAAPVRDPVTFPPGVRVSDRRIWGSPARDPRENGESRGGSGDGTSGRNESGNESVNGNGNGNASGSGNPRCDARYGGSQP